MERISIALGLITRRLDNPKPILRFLNNARVHGHGVDRFIVAYSHAVDPGVVEALRRQARVDVLRAHADPGLIHSLRAAGLSADEVEKLVEVPSWPCHREVPYGAYRNTVLAHALLTGIDYLLFFDSDVQPRVLTDYADGRAMWQEIDFVGGHLAHLQRSRVAATSSDYSGYYIIPPMRFDGLGDLLVGVGKDLALDYLADFEEHGCLNLGPAQPAAPVPTGKVLGGNLGLSLDNPRRLAPFFSTTYAVDGRCVLGRGEDTLLGQSIHSSDGLALDIDLRIFHDTYDDFPRVPDVRRKAVRDRFYRACLGWIGRNPFLIWLQAKSGRSGASFEAQIARQSEELARGGPKAARYLGDPRFATLAAALDESLAALPDMIVRYERLIEGWDALLGLLTPEQRHHAPPDEEDALVA